MGVKRKEYTPSKENFKKLKNYIKKLNYGWTKTDRQDSTRRTSR
jgi:archaellum biogenesis protein FlaJ (TadC family)